MDGLKTVNWNAASQLDSRYLKSLNTNYKYKIRYTFHHTTNDETFFTRAKPAGIFYDSIKGVMRSQFHLTRPLVLKELAPDWKRSP
jgi:hypothetical protein